MQTESICTVDAFGFLVLNTLRRATIIVMKATWKIEHTATTEVCFYI